MAHLILHVIKIAIGIIDDMESDRSSMVGGIDMYVQLNSRYRLLDLYQFQVH